MRHHDFALSTLVAALSVSLAAHADFKSAAESSTTPAEYSGVTCVAGCLKRNAATPFMAEFNGQSGEITLEYSRKLRAGESAPAAETTVEQPELGDVFVPPGGASLSPFGTESLNNFLGRTLGGSKMTLTSALYGGGANCPQPVDVTSQVSVEAYTGMSKAFGKYTLGGMGLAAEPAVPAGCDTSATVVYQCGSYSLRTVTIPAPAIHNLFRMECPQPSNSQKLMEVQVKLLSRTVRPATVGSSPGLTFRDTLQLTAGRYYVDATCRDPATLPEATFSVKATPGFAQGVWSETLLQFGQGSGAPRAFIDICTNGAPATVCDGSLESVCGVGATQCIARKTPAAWKKECQCGTGFKVGADGLCTDIDECQATPGICAATPTSSLALPAGILSSALTCVNTPGAYACACPSGTEYSDLYGTCITPVNECASATLCGLPHQSCADQLVGYTCVCEQGYRTLMNGMGCEPGSACLLAGGNDYCDARGARCMDRQSDPTFTSTDARDHYCACPPGFAGKLAVSTFDADPTSWSRTYSASTCTPIPACSSGLDAYCQSFSAAMKQQYGSSAAISCKDVAGYGVCKVSYTSGSTRKSLEFARGRPPGPNCVLRSNPSGPNDWVCP